MISNEAASNFLELLQAEAREFARLVSMESGDWTVKGFIDVLKNVYTISGDTKVVSKILELMLFPYFAVFADKYKFKMVLCKEQNHYPDLTFISEEGHKFAVDLKSTYRINSARVNTMTLGAFTGYFRNRCSTKNCHFPYAEYSGHFVLGAIYTRTKKADEVRIYPVKEIERIPSVIKDLRFFAQPKYRIAKDQPGSGNTKNMGAVNDLDALINGTGPFSKLGEEVFDDYWMYYMTADMARAVDLASPPYNNLTSYFEYKNINHE